jgi:hypothetical protein
MTAAALERGYHRAYREFYRWGAILRGASAHHDVRAGMRHAAYAAGWKKFEPLWDWIIRARRVGAMLPMLEAILTEFGAKPNQPKDSGVTIQVSGLGQVPGVIPLRPADS